MKNEANNHQSMFAHEPLTVQTTIKTTVAACWEKWINPADILLFNNPFTDWHTSKVEINFKVDGQFFYRMDAKNGKDGFDFSGKYTQIIPHERIESMGDDGRRAINIFLADGDNTILTEIFEPGNFTPLELQRQFCQNLLDSFKAYMEK